MQKNKEKTEKKPPVKKEDNSPASKNKFPEKAAGKEKIDEQNSDGSGGAFEEFIDQRHDE